MCLTNLALFVPGLFWDKRKAWVTTADKEGWWAKMELQAQQPTMDSIWEKCRSPLRSDKFYQANNLWSWPLAFAGSVHCLQQMYNRPKPGGSGIFSLSITASLY